MHANKQSNVHMLHASTQNNLCHQTFLGIKILVTKIECEKRHKIVKSYSINCKMIYNDSISSNTWGEAHLPHVSSVSRLYLMVLPSSLKLNVDGGSEHMSMTSWRKNESGQSLCTLLWIAGCPLHSTVMSIGTARLPSLKSWSMTIQSPRTSLHLL